MVSHCKINKQWNSCAKYICHIAKKNVLRDKQWTGINIKLLIIWEFSISDQTYCHWLNLQGGLDLWIMSEWCLLKLLPLNGIIIWNEEVLGEVISMVSWNCSPTIVTHVVGSPNKAASEVTHSRSKCLLKRWAVHVAIFHTINSNSSTGHSQFPTRVVRQHDLSV